MRRWIRRMSRRWMDGLTPQPGFIGIDRLAYAPNVEQIGGHYLCHLSSPKVSHEVSHARQTPEYTIYSAIHPVRYTRRSNNTSLLNTASRDNVLTGSFPE